MKIKHTETGCYRWLTDVQAEGIPVETPHKCGIKNCPGNLNRRRLELWNQMLAALIESRGRVIDDIGATEKLDQLIAKAKELK